LAVLAVDGILLAGKGRGEELWETGGAACAAWILFLTSRRRSTRHSCTQFRWAGRSVVG